MPLLLAWVVIGSPAVPPHLGRTTRCVFVRCSLCADPMALPHTVTTVCALRYQWSLAMIVHTWWPDTAAPLAALLAHDACCPLQHHCSISITRTRCMTKTWSNHLLFSLGIIIFSVIFTTLKYTRVLPLHHMKLLVTTTTLDFFPSPRGSVRGAVRACMRACVASVARRALPGVNIPSGEGVRGGNRLVSS